MRYVGERHIVIDGQPAPAPLWEPKREFDGQTVVIVGGGPSHAAVDLDLLRGRRLIAVNSSCRRVCSIAAAEDLLYFSDNSWAERFLDLIGDWPGRVATCNRRAQAWLGPVVRRIDILGLTERIGVIPDHVQASSGHIAACLAAVMGARRIVLIGFEAQIVDGCSHGHADYTQQDILAYAERFQPGWQGLAPAFRRIGVEVLNATPGSAITCFPVVDLREALAR